MKKYTIEDIKKIASEMLNDGDILKELNKYLIGSSVGAKDVVSSIHRMADRLVSGKTEDGKKHIISRLCVQSLNSKWRM